MNGSDRPMANPVAVLREEVDEWAILFNPDTSAAVGINPVGVQIWKALDGRRTVDAVVDRVKSLFSGVPETCADDIESFIRDLQGKGFVSVEGQSHSRPE